MDRTIDLRFHLPPFLYEQEEMKAVVEAENPELERLQQYTFQMKDNIFVLDTDEAGIARWEQLLSIRPQDNDDLATRQYRVQALLGSSQLPYTYRQLVKWLDSVCGEHGYTIDLQPERYNLMVRILAIAPVRHRIVYETLVEMIPANLILDLAGLEKLGGILYVSGGVVRERQRETLSSSQVFPAKVIGTIRSTGALVRERSREII